MRRLIYRSLIFVLTMLVAELPNSSALAQDRYRIEIIVERSDGKTWKDIDPRTILNRDDRIRFRVKSSFAAFLYVTYRSSSNRYETLFPSQGTGQQNKVQAGREYLIPQTTSAIRVADPPGQEIVYFLMSSLELTVPTKASGNPATARDRTKELPTIVPRCDDSILRARGDCIDIEAGPKPVGNRETLPSDLARIPNLRSRDLELEMEQNTSVVSSAEAVSGPVVYEIRLSHK